MDPELDCNDRVKQTFQEAACRVREISSKLKEEELLLFYGYYKQATEGPCTKPKPGWFQLSEKQKWQAWSALNEMNKEEAMMKYIDLLNTIDTNWQSAPPEKASAWVHHSSLKNTDEEIEDSAKTLFDWVKECNIIKVKELLNSSYNTSVDEDGLSLLHWAADRGCFDIVKHLIVNCQMDVNIKDPDGQTPLHYASSCGHDQVVQLLVESGADITIKDCDGQTPRDVASSLTVENIL